MQRIYACICIQVTVDHAEHQGEVGAWGVTKSSQCFGKSCIDICGQDCRRWYLCLRPKIKVYILVARVCVFVYSIRELKVILMSVLGQHECVWGKFLY